MTSMDRTQTSGEGGKLTLAGGGYGFDIALRQVPLDAGDSRRRSTTRNLEEGAFRSLGHRLEANK